MKTDFSSTIQHVRLDFVGFGKGRGRPSSSLNRKGYVPNRTSGFTQALARLN